RGRPGLLQRRGPDLHRRPAGRGGGVGRATPRGPPVTAVGERAPDFTLTDQNGRQVTLSEAVTQRHALLVFFPFAFSSICTGELLEIQLNIHRFDNDRVLTYGISCDAQESLRAW